MKQSERVQPHQFVQYVADNIDHNICVLDGRDTFHGMGMIAAVTPEGYFKRVMPRRCVKTRDIVNAAKVPLNHWSCSNTLPDIKFKPLPPVSFCSREIDVMLDVLWKVSPFLRQQRWSIAASSAMVSW